MRQRGYDWLVNVTGIGLISIENFNFKGVDYGVLSATIEKKSGNIKITGA